MYFTEVPQPANSVTKLPAVAPIRAVTSAPRLPDQVKHRSSPTAGIRHCRLPPAGETTISRAMRPGSVNLAQFRHLDEVV